MLSAQSGAVQSSPVRGDLLFSALSKAFRRQTCSDAARRSSPNCFRRRAHRGLLYAYVQVSGGSQRTIPAEAEFHPPYGRQTGSGRASAQRIRGVIGLLPKRQFVFAQKQFEELMELTFSDVSRKSLSPGFCSMKRTGRNAMFCRKSGTATPTPSIPSIRKAERV